MFKNDKHRRFFGDTVEKYAKGKGVLMLIWLVQVLRVHICDSQRCANVNLARTGVRVHICDSQRCANANVNLARTGVRVHIYIQMLRLK